MWLHVQASHARLCFGRGESCSWPVTDRGLCRQSSSRSALSGLQDLKGQWSGSAQAYGGGGGATNVDFNVRGQSWQWGDYALDQASAPRPHRPRACLLASTACLSASYKVLQNTQRAADVCREGWATAESPVLRACDVSAFLLMQVVANGSCHSIEGIKLEELGLKTGEAKLLVRGNLLGAAQDASIILTDFPVAILQPVLRALPALEHAAPAVAASGETCCLTRMTSAWALPRL